MRTNKLQFMRPNEIVEERNRKSIVYMPMGPLEWHSYHLPMGTDALAAEKTAEMAAKITGGIVMPTLFCGTERDVPAGMLDSLGFQDTTQYIIGMDYPANNFKSFYFREDIFAGIVREYLRLLAMQNYKLIVLVNGHAAANQMAVLERLAAEVSNESKSKVITFLALHGLEEDEKDLGHATKLETSIQMAIDKNNVDLGQLPPCEIDLKYSDWGIADMKAFLGKPSEKKTVESDPRDSTKELGEKYLEFYTKKLVRLIEEEYDKIGG